jgi:hypothetical protein
MTNFVEATESWAFETDGVPDIVNVGDKFPANDVIVKRFPGGFKPMIVRQTTSENVVEQATASPTEKRVTGAKRKKAA